eukprot:694982-Alexandrium_andersonii.AAC.1
MPRPCLRPRSPGPAVPLVPPGAVLSESRRGDVVNLAREAMSDAAQAEMTPMVYIQQAAELLTVRSQ